MIADDFAQKRSWQFLRLKVGQETFRLHFADKMPHVQPRQSLDVEGIALDHELAVSEVQP